MHVSLFEWGIDVDAVEVPAGAVTFVVQNDGNVGHALRVAGVGVSAETPVFPTGQTRTFGRRASVSNEQQSSNHGCG